MGDNDAGILPEPLPLGECVVDTEEEELAEGDCDRDPVPDAQGEGDDSGESEGDTVAVRVADWLPVWQPVDVPDTLPLGETLPLGVRVALAHEEGEAECEVDKLPDALPDTVKDALPHPVLLYQGLCEAHSVALWEGEGEPE